MTVNMGNSLIFSVPLDFFPLEKVAQQKVANHTLELSPLSWVGQGQRQGQGRGRTEKGIGTQGICGAVRDSTSYHWLLNSPWMLL